MKANKLYSGISATYSGVVLLFIYMTDTLYLSDKSKFSVLISIFGVMEFVKYFIIASQCPDVLKSLSAKVVSSSYPYSAHKSSSDKRSKQIFKGITLMAVMTAVYHVAIVLLGAGVIENFEETFLLSVLLSVLSFLPLCLYFGSNSSLGAIFNVYPAPTGSFEACLRQNLYGTLYGTWLGAFFIPLDWDRPWQKWPIPCAFGGIAGYCISNIIKIPCPDMFIDKFAV